MSVVETDERYWEAGDGLEDWADDDLGEEPYEDDEAYDDGYDALVDLGDGFREVLRDDYATMTPEETDRALLDVLESFAPAEALSIGNALSLVPKGALGALNDPTLRQIAGGALPVAGGLVGGPVGSSLGAVAGKALVGTPGQPPAPIPTPTTTPPPGSLPISTATTTPPLGSAATKALVLSGLPLGRQAMLQAALGELGRPTVAGMPVASVMGALSTLFGDAAAEADELMHAGDEAPSYLLDDDGSLRGDPASPADWAEALYDTLVAAEGEHMADLAGPQ